MNIKKCDICKKVITENSKTVNASIGWYSRTELCETCGAPVINFLIKHNLVKSDPLEPLKTKYAKTKR